MKEKALTILGIIGTGGSTAVSFLEVLNVYLTTLSLSVGISIGIIAAYKKLKK